MSASLRSLQREAIIAEGYARELWKRWRIAHRHGVAMRRQWRQARAALAKVKS